MLFRRMFREVLNKVFYVIGGQVEPLVVSVFCSW